MTRTAVVLFNLGGPDSLEAVEPFLFNLFSDPAIIRLPRLFRHFVAGRISRRRAPIAQEIYRQIGGKSPIVEQTEAQAKALQEALSDLGQVRVFIAMRYWHPKSDVTAIEVRGFAPDRIMLLPLYPQFSTTTSKSSLVDWYRAASNVGLVAPRVTTTALCCYATSDGMIEAQGELIAPLLAAAVAKGPVRLLLSAHGLPERIVKRGDPYAWQVEQTAARIVAKLGIGGLDWKLCYQSRVGPMQWIGPATEDEIKRAGADGVALVVAPIAFVSEHSETLVELDIEYRELAEASGVPAYDRAPAIGCHPAFISALADLTRQSLNRAPSQDDSMFSLDGGRVCPVQHSGCPLAAD
ncbi:MAG: ferrochelatase [Rhodospirillaceae bacterium]|nr:ferrochelatase [Rhodospirillaceae bacterium]